MPAQQFAERFLVARAQEALQQRASLASSNAWPWISRRNWRSTPVIDVRSIAGILRR
ncbi:MAG: hypothetical protein L0Z62_40545 [Gemmataceae bacterium]|nr:hypothetical protein [Gemmataceae bacterium]